MEEVTDEPLYRDRVCGIDIGKAQIAATIRVPSETNPARRASETRAFATTKRGVLALADWLRCWQVPAVVMEATGDYWKPVFYRLEAEGFECVLADAKQVKNLPGRPKRDPSDSRWLAQCFERGAVRSCFVPDPEFRVIRLHTRYRRDLTDERTREKNRAEKLLESAAIKLSSVITDLHGVTGRDIMDHLIAGERNPKVLAQLARTGRLTAGTGELTTVTGRLLAPYGEQLQQAGSMPGWGRRAAQDALAETGADMSRVPHRRSPGLLGRPHPGGPPVRHPQRPGQGQERQPVPGRHHRRTAVAAGRTKTSEGARYRRLARRRGKAKAQVALGNTQLKACHKLLSSPGMRYDDLGPDCYERQASVRRQIAHHVGKLGALGFDVTLCRITEPEPGGAASPNPNQADQAPHRPPDPYPPAYPDRLSMATVRCRAPS